MAAEPNADVWQLVSSEPDEEATPAECRWRRLVRSLYRIRRLQRIFGHLGQWLQRFDGDLRSRLQKKLK